ncbi:Rnase H [Bacillus phage Shbh1]|uniref:3'-5' exoribonuclease Rv2179c-like domain-containing protein n=1 Tax=Bacillus phage Shbh1 TaxID=1796992 RepID=A0A142F1B4_9CAUD|nr:Rnase H [Bacillus phage Shbh1]AMQ66571.1 hypothetical protein [Bacillus phage Shbh1]
MGKKSKVKCFYDFEFSGLHKNTTPISLGVTSSNGLSFYAEFTDYDKSQIDDWLEKNIINHLLLLNENQVYRTLGSTTFVKGTSDEVSRYFRKWLYANFEYVEFWGDCSWYDGVLLNEVLGGAFNLPDNVNYIYQDIVTLFRAFGIDPDISREAFIDKPIEGVKHNALYDSKVIQACYDKIVRNFESYEIKL